MTRIRVVVLALAAMMAFSGAILLARETKRTLVCGVFDSAKMSKRQALGISFNVVNVKLSDGRSLELEGIPSFTLEKGRNYSFLLRVNRRHGNQFLLSTAAVSVCSK